MSWSKIISVTAVIIFVFGIAMVGLAQAQKARTVKLPNGEEVVDISGEWDEQRECYGPWKQYGKLSNSLKITLKDSSFVGIAMKNNMFQTSGSETIRGELDKDGIKKAQIMTYEGPLDAKGKISEDGSKIIIDDGELVRLTLTRK